MYYDYILFTPEMGKEKVEELMIMKDFTRRLKVINYFMKKSITGPLSNGC